MEEHAPTWDGTDRRRALRLRKLVDELQAAVRENRTAIETLTRHFVDLTRDVDKIKETLKRSPSQR